MLIPWDLVASGLVAVAIGALVARRMAAPVGQVLDLVLAVGLPALLAARLAVIARDVALTGTVPPPAAWLTLTAGLSLPVGLLVALAVGARRLRTWQPDPTPTPPPSVPVVAVVSSWAGMVAWAAMSVVRGEVAGIRTPSPSEVLWPGSAATTVPTGMLEAAALAVLLWLALRQQPRDPAALGARLLLSLAGVHLVGGVLRPSLPTVDADLDVLLGLAALAAGMVARRRPARGTVRRATVTGVLVVSGLAAVTVLGVEGPAADADAVAVADPSLEGALVPGGEPAVVPTWGAADLQAFLAGTEGPVVVNVWASWCPPCHAEAPALARAVRALGEDVTVLGLLSDDTPQRGQGFADRYVLPFPTVVDGGAGAGLGLVGLPTTVVLDAEGTVVHRVVGGIDARSLASALQRARG